MKKLLLSVLGISLSCTVAYASWQDDFNQVYSEKGIDQAVEIALENGIDPDSIFKQALAQTTLDQEQLVKACYCAGLRGQDIRVASVDNDISDNTVTAGYKISLKECRDAVIAGQGAPVSDRYVGSVRNRSRERSRTYGSPSTFQ